MDKYTGAGLISIAMGGLSLILGVLFRTGLVQADLARQYRDPTAPLSRRNAVFAFIPLGLGFVALGLLPLLMAVPQWGIVLARIAVLVGSWIFWFRGRVPPAVVDEAPRRRSCSPMQRQWS